MAHPPSDNELKKYAQVNTTDNIIQMVSYISYMMNQ